MAKEKKRGFFSWFGRNRQEEKTEQEEVVVSPEETTAPDAPVDAAPAEPKPAEPEITHVPEAAPAQPEPVKPEPTLPEPVNAEPVAAAVPEQLAQEIVTLTEQVADEQAIAHQPVEQTDAAIPALANDRGEPLSDAVLEEEQAAPLELAPIVPAEAVTQEQERPTKEGFFARLKRSLVKTKQNLGSGFISLFRGKKIDDDLFEELEEQLLIADVGVETTRRIITSLTQHASRKELKDAEQLYGKLKEEMAEILAKVDEPLDVTAHTPFVILMVGVNGVGKTTTIGKLARQFEAQGKSVMLAAGDTFRAAAVEQLQVWGQRNNIPVVAQHTGADSASVIFDALQAAKARKIDVLIADTAGRLQNKSHLMEELKKIVRVMKKLDENAPHEVMLTLDASTGQNAVSQAKLFNEAVGLTGITLTKLDGTAKGGVIFSIADQFGIPIRYIGVGESIEDLRPFKADDFIEALFARED
ncbi:MULTISPECIES: signal recognition particle-docking protein FtsY [Yersiniaceae]|uniref:Signal recognition particle receptor FtsY n=2 Tax=Yersiniaceae TaxID=1903411 RepID=A0A2N5EI23_9GAMM|nr:MULTISPECIES: signal recognition particle-docking protein FtsY [Yersiniaceae]MBS0971058.1 signal recognition particle-docking protein FtsY [Nissabacter archeti]PLR30335.1 signal recognition particle-docking protein FtsY [Chimaeribacter arupi]PLR44172.1 signal recognition particle-docking protein FtsY [Chimaeribacter arupi]